MAGLYDATMGIREGAHKEERCWYRTGLVGNLQCTARVPRLKYIRVEQPSLPAAATTAYECELLPLKRRG